MIIFGKVKYNYVEDEVSDATIGRLIEAGLGEFDPRLPQKLLAALFGCILHIYGVDDLDYCAEIFTTQFYPSYIKRSL